MGTAQELNFTQFGRAEGLPADGVYDLMQAENGLLWIATEGGGVSSFDGKEFTTYTDDSGLPDNTVRCLFEDSKHRIWIGTANGGVAFFENKEWHIPRFNIELPAVHIRSFIEDASGNLYISMFKGGIVKIENNQLFEFTQQPIAKASVRTLQKDSQNQLWAGSDEGIFLINKEEISPHPLDSVGIKTVCSLPYKTGVLFGTDNGLLYASADSLMWLNHPLINRTRIKSIVLDSHGDLWLGSSSGAFQFSWKSDFEVEIINLVTESEGLENARIRKLLLDRSNTLWFGTYYGGVAQLKGEAFSKFTRENHYPENYITSLHFVGNTIWIGTFEGSIYQSDGSQLIKVYQSTSTDADNPVHRIFNVDEQVAAVVQNDGLVLFNQSKPRLQATDYPPYKDAVMVGDQMHVFTSSSISTLSNSKFTFKWDGINVAEVNDDEVLLGTIEGIARIPVEGSELKYNQLEWISGSEQLQITCAAKDSQGNVWFGSSNQGLSRWNGVKLKIYSRKSILPHPHVSGITFDSNDNLWVSTRKGMVHVELDPNQEFVLNTTEYENAIPGYAAPHSMELSVKDEIWMGTTMGMFKYHPNGEYKNTKAPALALTKVFVNSNPIDSSYSDQFIFGFPVNPAFKHDENNITFGFSGVDLAAENGIKFQYLLEGLSVDWQKTMSNEVTFPKLPHGDYSFILRACNSDGRWTKDPLRYNFSINQPWYSQWWGIIALSALFFLIIWSGIHWRLSRLKKQRDKLEQQVQVRTQELEKEKERSETLLLNILPEQTAEELKNQGFTETRSYDNASVLFSDFKGFTQMAEAMNSRQLVEILDQTFQAFDDLCDKYHVEKIKTIGDAYMCATGIPQTNEQHATLLVDFAMEMRESMKRINQKNKEKGLPEWNLRIGIHSGPLIAGVVGKKKFAYDIWGDTVNIAARMESSGEINRINISDTTMELISNDFLVEYRGKITAKNKGSMEMYFVNERKRT